LPRPFLVVLLFTEISVFSFCLPAVFSDFLEWPEPREREKERERERERDFSEF
jgi:hypothetical protein